MSDIQEKINQLKGQDESIEKLAQLGDLYLEKGDIVEAQHYYEEAAEKFPDQSLGFVKLGELTLMNGELKAANNYFDQATTADKGNALAWIGFARANLASGGLSRANEYVDKALALSQDDTVLLHASIVKLKANDIFYAEKYLKQLEEKKESPLLPFAKFYLGLLNVEKSLFIEAMEYFKEIEGDATFNSNDKNTISLKNNMALCSIRTGAMDVAQSTLESIKDTEDVRILMNLAMVYWIQDKIDEAKETLTKINKIDPNAFMWVEELNQYIEGGEEWSKTKIDSLLQENPEGYNVVLFLGCVIPNRYPFVEAATRHVFNALNIGIVEADGASCCPAPGVFRSFDQDTWMVMGARNITISEEKKRDFVTMCNGCYGTLNDVNYELKHEKEKKDFVNDTLKAIGKEYKGDIEVRHIVDVLYNTIGVENLKKLIVNKFEGLKVGVHYGCHILKPHFNKPWPLSATEDPKFLDELVELTGATSVAYKDKLMCCGAGGAVRSWTKDTSLDFTKEKLMNMREAGVDVIIDCCPFCHLQMDLGQMEINGAFKDEIGEPLSFPIIYITQLLGLAMGLDPFRLGLLKTPKQPGTPPFIKVEPFFTKKMDDIELK